MYGAFAGTTSHDDAHAHRFTSYIYIFAWLYAYLVHSVNLQPCYRELLQDASRCGSHTCLYCLRETLVDVQRHENKVFLRAPCVNVSNYVHITAPLTHSCARLILSTCSNGILWRADGSENRQHNNGICVHVGRSRITPAEMSTGRLHEGFWLVKSDTMTSTNDFLIVFFELALV